MVDIASNNIVVYTTTPMFNLIEFLERDCTNNIVEM